MPRFVAVLAATAVGPTASAAEKAKGPPKTETQTVELFAAVAAKQIEVQVIPLDATQCNLLLKNLGERPLSVQLPKAFAAVPVAAQFGMPFPDPNQPQQNAPQRLAVGVPPVQPPFLRPGPGPFNVRNPRNQQQQFPFFNVAPEQVGKVKLPAVCLDHGKPNPRPAIKYELKALETVCDAPGIAEVGAMLGSGELKQRVAQLAAWHLSNGLSWEKLAGVQEKIAFGTRATYSRQEIDAARQAVEKAVKQAKESKEKPSEGKAASLSRR